MDIALSSKTLISYADILAVIQTLSEGSLLSIEQIEKVLNYIADSIILINNETDVFKIMQLIIVFINKNVVINMSSKILFILLKAFSINNVIVQNTIGSILRRMYSILFSSLTLQDVEKDDTGTFKICYEQLEVILKLIKNERKDMKHTIIGMDLLNVIFDEFGPMMTKSKKIRNEYIQSLIPILFNYLNDKNNSFGLLFHVVNLAIQTMISFTNYYGLILPILKWQDSDADWKKYLALEAIGVILGSSKQIPVLYSTINSETNTNMLNAIISTLLRMLKSIEFYENDIEVVPKPIILGKEKLFIDIGKWLVNKPPELFYYHFLWSITEILLIFIRSIEELAIVEKFEFTGLLQITFTSHQINRLIKPLEDIWKSVNILLLFLYKEASNENNIQKILMSLQCFVKIMAGTRLIPQMNEVIKTLCKLSLPIKIRKYIFIYRSIY